MKAKMKMITAMLIFGSIGLFVRAIDMPSSVLALMRGAVGTVFLLMAGIVLRSRISVKAVKKNLLLLVLSGAAIGINWICLFEAYRYTTIAAATLCYYLAPVFVMAASPVILKERLTPFRAVCITVSLFGMFLVADLSDARQGGSDVKGIIFGLMAAFFYAGVVLMNKRIKQVRAMDMTVTQLGAAAIALLPYVLLTENGIGISVNGSTLFLLLFVGIVNTGFAYLLYFSSLSELSAQTAALFSYMDPVAAIILSAVLLKEEMSVRQMIGAVLILGATLMSELIGGRGTAGRRAELT